MITQQSTRRHVGDLTTQQRAQLAAMLCDTTAGAAHYRPPVARNIEIVRDLEAAGLVIFTIDCGYEITGEGRALVAQLDKADAIRESQARALNDADLLAALRAMPGELEDAGVDPVRRAGALADFAVIRAEYARREAEAELRFASAEPGRHDREVFEQTLVFAAVEGPHGGQVSGTLPGLPVVPADPLDIVDEQDPAYLAQLQDVLDGARVDDDPYADWLDDRLAVEDAGFFADEPDFGWLRRTLTPRRRFILAIVVTIIVTWGAAWLVMGR